MILLLLPVLLAETTVQVQQFHSSETTISLANVMNEMFDGFQLPFLYPIIILILASLALREEISNDTISYLWVKPISRESILLSKFLVVFLVAFILSALSLLFTAKILDANWDIALNLLFAAGISLLAYGSFFLVLSLYMGRAILVGFFYILIWENLLSKLSPLASSLSIRSYAQNLTNALLNLPCGGTSDNPGTCLPTATSIIVLLLISVGSLALSVWRFSKMEFPGEME
ncbi:ABC transporter permease subunit [Candidatus Acetothermia bacterium]|nr:ABC transporter permease subunit [Candidatus Acetothermia bacterium]